MLLIIQRGCGLRPAFVKVIFHSWRMEGKRCRITLLMNVDSGVRLQLNEPAINLTSGFCLVALCDVYEYGSLL